MAETRLCRALDIYIYRERERENDGQFIGKRLIFSSRCGMPLALEDLDLLGFNVLLTYFSMFLLVCSIFDMIRPRSFRGTPLINYLYDGYKIDSVILCNSIL